MGRTTMALVTIIRGTLRVYRAVDSNWSALIRIEAQIQSCIPNLALIAANASDTIA